MWVRPCLIHVFTCGSHRTTWSLFSPLHVSSQDWTQITRLLRTCLNLLSHLASPTFFLIVGSLVCVQCRYVWFKLNYVEFQASSNFSLIFFVTFNHLNNVALASCLEYVREVTNVDLLVMYWNPYCPGLDFPKVQWKEIMAHSCTQSQSLHFYSSHFMQGCQDFLN